MDEPGQGRRAKFEHQEEEAADGERVVGWQRKGQGTWREGGIGIRLLQVEQSRVVGWIALLKTAIGDAIHTHPHLVQAQSLPFLVLFSTLDMTRCRQVPSAQRQQTRRVRTG